MARADAIKKLVKYISDAINAKPIVRDVLEPTHSPTGFKYGGAPKGEYPSYSGTMTPEQLAIRAKRLNNIPVPPPGPGDNILDYIGDPGNYSGVESPSIEWEVLNDATRKYFEDGNEPLNQVAYDRTKEAAERILGGSDLGVSRNYYGLDPMLLARFLEKKYPSDPASVRARLEEFGYETEPMRDAFGRLPYNYTLPEEFPISSFWRGVPSSEAYPAIPGHTTRLYNTISTGGPPVNVFAARNPDVARTYIQNREPDRLLTDNSIFSTAYGITPNDIDLMEELGVSGITNYGKPIVRIPSYTMPIAPKRTRLIYEDEANWDNINPATYARHWSRLNHQPMFDTEGNRYFTTPEFYRLPLNTDEAGVDRYLGIPRDARESDRTSELYNRSAQFLRDQYGYTLPLEYRRIMDLGGHRDRIRIMDPHNVDMFNSSAENYTGSDILAGDTTNMRSQIGLAIPELLEMEAPWLLAGMAGAAYGLGNLPTYPTSADLEAARRAE